MMKNFVLILILSFTVVGSYAQDYRWSEVNADLGLTDTINQPIEIRIYMDLSITNYSSVFRMYKDESGIWHSVFYEHRAAPNSEDVRTLRTELTSKSDMRYVYLNLMRSHIFELPDMQQIDWKLSDRGVIEKTSSYNRRLQQPETEYQISFNSFSTTDGVAYYFQVSNQFKSNSFAYGSPCSYQKRYPEVDELIYVCELIEIIKSEFDIWTED
jgi:hypothetical protein